MMEKIKAFLKKVNLKLVVQIIYAAVSMLVMGYVAYAFGLNLLFDTSKIAMAIDGVVAASCGYNVVIFFRMVKAKVAEYKAFLKK